MSILLDTTVLIDILRGRESARERIAAVRGDPMASAISVAEIFAGLREPERDPANALFDGLVLVAVGRREGAVSGDWRRDFARRGITLARFDTLIAACALTSGVPLATANVKDFPMPEIEVQHWSST